MNHSLSNDKHNYEELKLKYDNLEKRFNSVMKMNDRTMKNFFIKNVKAHKLNKRFNTIIKQSDRQTKHLLNDNEKQEQLLIEQSKMASMGEMLENIAHQMKQPLSLITTSSGALELQKEMDILSDEEFIQYTHKISEATQYLSDTIDNFRDFFQENKIKQKFSITSAIIKSKKLLETKFKDQNIKLIYELSDIELYGIKNEFIQVITNMLSNSIDALKQNENEKLIFITSSISKNNIIIKFWDNAAGIENNIISKIFDAHFTTKDKENGSGIGLHMTKMIIENNFLGKITVDNHNFTYNENSYIGAEFSIILPIL